MSETVKTSKTLVQLKLPSGMVNERRLLLNATRNERHD